VNRDLRGAGTFECPRCRLRINRQKNAARNIWAELLKMWGQGLPRKELSSMKHSNEPRGDEGGEA